MNRKLSMVLLGATLLIPADADAQRRGRRAEPQPRPTREVVVPAGRVVTPNRGVVGPGTGRLANCRAPSHGRSYVCTAATTTRRNVVYRYAGDDHRRFDRLWISAGWTRLYIVPVRGRMRDNTLGPNQLREMIGPAAVRRVHRHGQRAGLRGPVRGHWFESRRDGMTLTLTMGHLEVAQILDYDRDGLADEVLLRNFGRW